MTEIANYGYEGKRAKNEPKDEYHPYYPEAKASNKSEPVQPKPEVSGYDCTAQG